VALRTSDFDRLYRGPSRRQRSERFLVLAQANRRGETRWGISVKTRLGGAVVRNRMKRRLREILRGAGLPGGWDIVVQPRTARVASDPFEDLRRELTTLLERTLRAEE
jgi:ribonuclease P protein component